MLLCWHFWKTFELQFSPFLGLPEQERMGDAGAAQVMLSQHLHPCWLTLRWFGAWIFPRVDLAGKPGTNLMFCVQILANKHPQWWGSSWALPRAVTPSPTEHIYIWITSTSSYVSCFLLFRLNTLLGRGISRCCIDSSVNIRKQSPRSSNPGMSSLGVTNINKRRLGWNSI